MTEVAADPPSYNTGLSESATEEQDQNCMLLNHQLDTQQLETSSPSLNMYMLVFRQVNNG